MSLSSSNPISASPGGDAARLRHSFGRSPGATRPVLRFWLPLALTPLLVALSGPALNVTLGRAPDPSLHLAAFWVAFTIALFVESGALAVQQAALALGADRGPLRRIAGVALVLGAASSLVVLALAAPAPSKFVFGTLVPTSPRAATLAVAVLGVLAPLPLLVAARGLAAAIALRRGRSRLVAAAAGLRVGVVGLLVAAGLSTGIGSGAIAAAWALIAGTAAETAWLVAAAWPRVRARVRRSAAASAGVRPAGRGALRVIVPLVVASATWTATRPVVNAVLGRLADPEAAQAAFGVALPVLMIACAPLWALHEAAVVLPRGPADLARVARFAAIAAAAFTAAIALVAFTPLGGAALGAAFHLAPPLRAALAPALAVLVLEPFALATRAVAQGVLVRTRRTGAFLAFAPLRLAAMLVAGLAVAASFPHANGAVLGLALVVGGDLLDAGLCAWRARRVLAQGGVPGTAAEDPAPALRPRVGEAESSGAAADPFLGTAA